LCTSSIQAQLQGVHSDPRSYKATKMRERGADQLIDIDSLPLVPDQQVLIGCERPDALIKAPDKVFRLPRRGLAPACTRLSMFSAP
jgi:hypothetical protein